MKEGGWRAPAYGIEWAPYGTKTWDPSWWSRYCPESEVVWGDTPPKR